MFLKLPGIWRISFRIRQFWVCYTLNSKPKYLSTCESTKNVFWTYGWTRRILRLLFQERCMQIVILDSRMNKCCIFPLTDLEVDIQVFSHCNYSWDTLYTQALGRLEEREELGLIYSRMHGILYILMYSLRWQIRPVQTFSGTGPTYFYKYWYFHHKEHIIIIFGV